MGTGSVTIFRFRPDPARPDTTGILSPDLPGGNLRFGASILGVLGVDLGRFGPSILDVVAPSGGRVAPSAVRRYFFDFHSFPKVLWSINLGFWAPNGPSVVPI